MTATKSRAQFDQSDSDTRLVVELAHRVLGWSAGPDRFRTLGRAWIPRWRFSPLTEIKDAVFLLDHVATRYSIRMEPDRQFWVDVEIKGRTGMSVGGSQARAITVAIARALGLEVDGEVPD